MLSQWALRLGSPLAVSYTHLDVYKRQGHDGAQRVHRRGSLCCRARSRRSGHAHTEGGHLARAQRPGEPVAVQAGNDGALGQRVRASVKVMSFMRFDTPMPL